MMRIEGVVEHGRKLGRELGFPTVNLAVPEGLALPDGVYAARTEVDGILYRAVANLGRNPSVGGNARRLEAHLIGFNGDLYGRRIIIELGVHLRDEQRFDSLDALREQINRDREAVINME